MTLSPIHVFSIATLAIALVTGVQDNLRLDDSPRLEPTPTNATVADEVRPEVLQVGFEAPDLKPSEPHPTPSEAPAAPAAPAAFEAPPNAERLTANGPGSTAPKSAALPTVDSVAAAAIGSSKSAPAAKTPTAKPPAVSNSTTDVRPTVTRCVPRCRPLRRCRLFP